MRSLLPLALVASLAATSIAFAPAASAAPSQCTDNVVSVGNLAGVCTYETLRNTWTINNEGPVCVGTACPWVGHTGIKMPQPCVVVWSVATTTIDVCP